MNFVACAVRCLTPRMIGPTPCADTQVDVTETHKFVLLRDVGTPVRLEEDDPLIMMCRATVRRQLSART